MKYLYNPETDSFESLEPTLRDRFVLGGRVNFDKGSPFPITDEVLKQIDDLMGTLKSLDFRDAFVLDEVGDMGKGGLEVYYQQLKEVFGFTDTEIRTIDRNAYLISATYATYPSQESEPQTEEGVEN